MASAVLETVEMSGLENPEVFLNKFDEVLRLLQTFANSKGGVKLSEDATFLLEKTLDFFANIQNSCTRSFYAVMYERTQLRKFFEETLKMSTATVLPPEVLIFSIQFGSVLLNDDYKLALVQEKIPSLISSVLSLTQSSAVENQEVKLALLKFVTTLAKLSSGPNLIDLCHIEFACSSLSDSTIFTVKAAQELLLVILKSFNVNQERLLVTLNLIIKVLNEKGQVLMRSLEVLESFFSSAKDFQNVSMVISELKLEDILLKLLASIENEELLLKISAVLAVLYAKFSTLTESSEWKVKAIKLLHVLLNRGFLKTAIQITARSLSHWTKSEKSQTFILELLYLMLIPVHMDTDEIEVYYDTYQPHLQEWENSASSSTRSVGNLMHSMMKNNSDLDEFTHIAICGLLKNKSEIGKEVALKVTRSLLFLLGCVKLPQCKRNSMIRQSPHLGICLIEAACGFIESYTIKWWESPETICLPATITKLIQNNASVNTQVTCAALKGLRFCVSQFLHPNQALLLNTVNNSSLEELAEVVHRCCHSMHWEVRDSALEVVLEMSQLSSSRFPAFQQLLLNSGLLKTAVLALKDTESYVRATALLSIAAMAEAPSLQEQLWQETNVTQDCIDIIQHDTEAIARRAAAKALTKMYSMQNLRCKDTQQHFLQIMASAALNDLDWEVKLEALNLWELIIKATLQRQGMIDGSFPQMTFSIEKQKIVRLDSKEIRWCLQAALTELSTNGCLSVLLHCADDFDSSVRERALQMLRGIKDLLGKYQALDLQLMPGRVDSKETAVLPAGIPEQDNTNRPSNADSVIEEIVNQNDLNLVSKVMVDCDRYSRAGNESSTNALSEVSPAEFVTTINGMEIQDLLQQSSKSSDLHCIDFSNLLQDLEDCVYTGDGRPFPDCY